MCEINRSTAHNRCESAMISRKKNKITRWSSEPHHQFADGVFLCFSYLFVFFFFSNNKWINTTRVMIWKCDVRYFFFVYLLHVINTNNLIDPADEGRHFDVDAWHLSPAAAETPADQTTQFVIAFVLAHQRTSAVTLTVATYSRLVKELQMRKFMWICITWQASLPASPPAQKLDAGMMKIFSVTALICRTNSPSLTIGTSASRTRNGIGPANN